ncbi:hypothetical protein P5V15_013969 [Pogonomyrmex californicus]
MVSSLKECNESVVRNESDAAGNSISLNKIERFDKFTRRRMRSQRVPDSPATSKEEATEDDVSRWIDFNKMATYITEVHLFYKLEYFQCSIQVAGNMLEITNKDYKTTSTENIKKDKADTYNIHKILKSRYKPLYLFYVDSHEKDYLILQRFNSFFVSDLSDQSVTISTTGSKSIVMELEAGRQLLQIHSRSDSNLIIISSDTDFHLGDRTIVQQLMKTESNRIEQISKMISNSLYKAYRSFGTKDYPAMLGNYYRSYMPNVWLASSKENKKLRTLIHHFFMEEQIRLIKETVSNEELENIFHSLRVFFLNPQIRLEYLNLMTNHKSLQDLTMKETWKTFLTSRNHEEISKYDQAATIIQSFFKMALIKRYKQLHDSDHALHMQIRNWLLKISDLFDSSLASRLLRNVINRHTSLCDLYPCSGDFVHVLNIQEFRGVLGNVRYKQWFPIVRFIVNPKPAQKVLAAFELIIDLPHFALRVFNNQNKREMTRLINHVAPICYEYLPYGYTVFAYSWNNEQNFKELDWIIRVITIKGDPMLYQLNEQWPLSLETKLPRLMVDELVDIYIPNARNCIARWILQTTSERSIVSIRLTTSYNLAEIRIEVVDESNNILADVNGSSTVLLPLVILEYPTKNNEVYKIENNNQGVNKKLKNTGKEKNLYYIEAFVLNNSWPLTDVEWVNVNQTKTKNVEDLMIIPDLQSGNKTSSSSLSTMKKNKQLLNNDQPLEPPYWILQIVTDAQDAIEICQDQSRVQNIALLKESWLSKSPNRSERGKDLREIFLNAHILKIEPDASLNLNESKLIENEDAMFCLSHVRQYRTLKSPKPPLSVSNMMKYMRRDEAVKHYWIKTKSDDEILKNQYINNITNNQSNYFRYLENLAKLINKQLQKYIKYIGKKEETFWQRRVLVDAVYETRRTYTDNLTSERLKIKEKGKKD